jgi:glycosyltransferase involved in cell wall biosynthesis
VNLNDADGLPPNPPISVYVPMFSNSTTIERCLRSVLDQDGVEFEIVVVDDDSSDESAAIAGTMLRPGDRLIRNASRFGLNQNHNKCLEHARGRFIQFVHGDDWLLPGALQTLARCFDDPTVGMAFAPRRVMNDDLTWRRRYGRVHTHFQKLRGHNHGPSLVTDRITALAVDLHKIVTVWGPADCCAGCAADEEIVAHPCGMVDRNIYHQDKCQL